MIKRRDFIINSGLALGAVALSPSLAFAAKPKNIGIQLYTLREAFSKDVKGVLEHVAKAGYKEVVLDGFAGEEGPSGHYDFKTFIKDNNADFLKASIECANQLGSEYVVIPWLEDTLRSQLDDYKRIAQKANEAALLCKKAGLKLAYHNHDFEFTTFGNQTGDDILLHDTDKKLVD